MRHDIPADIEKTQAPPTPFGLREREIADKQYLADRLEDRCCEAARPMTHTELLGELFRYHPPTEEQLPKYAAINQAAKNFAEIVLANCPRGADFSRVIHLIQDARMTANRSIALNGLSL
jgi:hypothetical protein